MTGRERRIAELAAQDLEGWARELPLGSETRRDLQQTARVYRFAARAGAVALSAVPDVGAGDGTPAEVDGAVSRGRDRASDGPDLVAAPPPLESPLDRGA